MRKNKEAYMNFVCPYCWHTLDQCTCELFPPYSLIFVDEKIQEHVRVLNEKGYCTIGSCEGHLETCTSTYVCFADSYFEEAKLPDGFKYNKVKRMIFHEYNVRILTAEGLEQQKREYLDLLLEWCKCLPDRML